MNNKQASQTHVSAIVVPRLGHHSDLGQGYINPSETSPSIGQALAPCWNELPVALE